MFGDAVVWVPRPPGASQSPWVARPEFGLAPLPPPRFPSSPLPRRVLTLLGRGQRQQSAHRWPVRGTARGTVARVAIGRS